jgi:hypothetical protein
MESDLPKFAPLPRKEFTEADVQAAHDKLRRHVQKLVDRFGQAQTYEIFWGVISVTCPDSQGLPKYIFLTEEKPKAVN